METHANNASVLVRRRGALALLCAAVFIVASFFAGSGFFAASANSEPQEQLAAAAAPVDVFAGIALQAKAAYVLDVATGKVLFARNADAQLPLASITKVPLALAVSEVLPAESSITIPQDTAPPGSIQRLAAGDEWKVRDVLDFTLVASSNGGAEILADAANAAVRLRYPQAPQEGATIWRMNELAKELGLTHTYFLNASGLDMSTTEAGSYSSARDVAELFAYASQNWPQVFSQTARNDITLHSQNGATTRAINTDEALSSIPGLIMGKTGYTDLAGGNLAIVFDVGPTRPIVAVVLGSTFDGRFSDMKEIVSRAQRAVAQE